MHSVGSRGEVMLSSDALVKQGYGEEEGSHWNGQKESYRGWAEY